MKADSLTPREGKVLRYVSGKTRLGDGPVTPEMCVIRIKWSDLPQSKFQAVTAIATLVGYKLIKAVEGGYEATASGQKLIASANKAGLWNEAPAPHITNKHIRRNR